MGGSVLTVVAREQLYEMIWREPTKTVAARLGLSDVGLAKICRKLHIPLPWRGYWREKETGHANRPPKLPPWPEHRGPEPGPITFQAPEPPAPGTPIPPRPAEPESVQAQRRYEVDHPIAVPSELVEPHRLVRRAVQQLKKADERGFLIAREYPCLAIHVSASSLDRALRLFDAFLNACQSRDWAVECLSERPWRTRVAVHGEAISVGIDEKIRTIPARRKPSTQINWQFPLPQDTYAPTGLLTFWAISDEGYATGKRTWNDGKRQRVEHCLNDVMIGLVQIAEARKAAHRAALVRQREMAEEVRRQQVATERRAREQERRDELQRQASAWMQSRELQAYLDALKLAAGPQIAQDPDGRLGKWVRWAEAYVRELDPMRTVETLPDGPTRWGRHPIDLSEVAGGPSTP